MARILQYTLVTMDRQTQKTLLHINRQFYDQFAGSFSDTRGRVQPGARALLPRMVKVNSILDVGCGNGTLARALDKAGFEGEYVGVDMSPGLLSKATEMMASPSTGVYTFQQVDLSDSRWHTSIPAASFEWVVCFAVLHHLPGEKLRRETVQAFEKLLSPEGQVAVSVWQWQNSPRLSRRIQSWSQVGLEPEALDAGDVLLDWRAGETIGLRYVHTFTQTSLSELAESAGLKVLETFYSDGKVGNLALYQIWQK